VLTRLLASPDLVLDQGGGRVLLLKRLERMYVAAVKTTRDGAENYLVSFRRARPKDVARLRRRYPAVRGEPGRDGGAPS
jgi:hypothetical protein